MYYYSVFENMHSFHSTHALAGCTVNAPPTASLRCTRARTLGVGSRARADGAGELRGGHWCLARRRGKEEFGDTAASAADYNGYRLVNGNPSGRLPRVSSGLLGVTGARARSYEWHAH